MMESRNHPAESFLIEGGDSRHASFWLLYLYARPRRFFGHFQRTATWFSTLYASLLVGLAYAIDRVSLKIVQSELTGRPKIPEFLLESWAAYWVFCVVLGCVSAAMYYGLGGWWYRVRLGWAGAVEPDKRVARQVYIFAILVTALPCVIITGIDSFRFSTPMVAESRGGPAWLIVVALAFYSIYVSYRGVRTVFDTVRWKAVVWFLVLPLLVYIMAFVASIAASIGGLLSMDGGQQSLSEVAETLIDSPKERLKKDIAELEALLENLDEDVPNDSTPVKIDPVRYDFPTFQVEAPGTWFPEGLGEVEYPQFEVTFSETVMKRYVVFEFRRPGGDDAEITRATVGTYTMDYADTLVREFTTWGNYSGAGMELTNPTPLIRGTLRIFTTQSPRYRVTIAERWPAENAERHMPGFELVRRTFRLKP